MQRNSTRLRTKSSLFQRVFQGVLLASFLLALTVSSGDAEAATKKKTKKTKARPRAARTVSTTPSSALYADLVIDANTGAILHETSGTSPRHPASLTKMMTLYLAFQAIENGVIRLETPLRVSARAASQSPSKLGLRTGQTITAYDAIMGLITCSANDGAVVLAEALGGDSRQFADMMTRQAKALGMQNTVFKNPNGLPDPNQITTARDMAMLGYGLVSHFPGFYSYFSKNNFTYKGRSYNNHNNLMKRYDGMDGIKTGYIRASGFNLVASATRGDTRLIGVVFGGRSAASRDNVMEKLLDDAFTDFHQSNHMNVATLPLPTKVAAIFGGTRTAATPAPTKPTLSAASRSQRPRLTMMPAASSVAPTAPTAPGSLGTLSLKDGDQIESSGAWGIQVGSYSSVDAAQQAIASLSQNMARTLGDAEPSLQKITMTDGSAMYRARFIGLDKASARSACSQVIRRGQGCLVVMEP